MIRIPINQRISWNVATTFVAKLSVFSFQPFNTSKPQDTERQDEYGHLGVCQTKRRFAAEVEAKNLRGRMKHFLVKVEIGLDSLKFSP